MKVKIGKLYRKSTKQRQGFQKINKIDKPLAGHTKIKR